jgi:hypothetical protein
MQAPHENSYDDVCSVDSDDTSRTEIADLAPPRVTELKIPSLTDLLLTGFCSPTKPRFPRGGEPANDSANFSLEVSASAATRKNDVAGQRVKTKLFAGETGPDSSFYGLLFCKPTKPSLSSDVIETQQRAGDKAIGETSVESDCNDDGDEPNFQEAVSFGIFSFRLLEVLVFTVSLYCLTFNALKSVDKELVFELTPKAQHRRLPMNHCVLTETPRIGDIDQ